MSAPYVLAPLDDVKGLNNYPEYIEALRALQEAAIARGQSIWDGYTFGGVNPKANQFGMVPLRMNEMAKDVSSSTASGSYSFRKNFSGTGWKDIFNYSTRKDTIHAFAGFAVTDEALRLSQFRMQISETLYPIIDIQEANAWKAFALIIKQDVGAELVVQEEKTMLLRGYVETVGYQRVVPIGFMLYKRKDLVITEI